MIPVYHLLKRSPLPLQRARSAAIAISANSAVFVSATNQFQIDVIRNTLREASVSAAHNTNRAQFNDALRQWNNLQDGFETFTFKCAVQCRYD